MYTIQFISEEHMLWVVLFSTLRIKKRSKHILIIVFSNMNLMYISGKYISFNLVDIPSSCFYRSYSMFRHFNFECYISFTLISLLFPIVCCTVVVILCDLIFLSLWSHSCHISPLTVACVTLPVIWLLYATGFQNCTSPRFACVMVHCCFRFITRHGWLKLGKVYLS